MFVNALPDVARICTEAFGGLRVSTDATKFRFDLVVPGQLAVAEVSEHPKVSVVLKWLLAGAEALPSYDKQIIPIGSRTGCFIGKLAHDGEMGARPAAIAGKDIGIDAEYPHWSTATVAASATAASTAGEGWSSDAAPRQPTATSAGRSVFMAR